MAFVVLEREVETTKSGIFESEEVADRESLAVGVVEEIPREAGVAFQKKFGLSWVRSPEAPMKGTEPWVSAVVRLPE